MNLDRIINLLAAVTLVEMMITIGLGVSVAEIGHVARDGRLLIRAAIANYVIVPAAAVGLLLALHAPPMVAAGFLVAAACPGAPFGPPFVSLAKGNVATAVGLMVVMAASSAVAAPLVLYVAMPITCGDQAATVNVVKMIGTLFGAQLLPLGIGLWVRHARATLAERCKPVMQKGSTLLNLVTFGLIFAAQLKTLIGIRLVGYAGMLALVMISAAAGWLLGGTGGERRTSMAVTTAVRNVGVAMVIATGSFAGTAAVPAATAFALFQTIAVALLAVAWGRRHGPTAASPSLKSDVSIPAESTPAPVRTS